MGGREEKTPDEGQEGYFLLPRRIHFFQVAANKLLSMFYSWVSRFESTIKAVTRAARNLRPLRQVWGRLRHKRCALWSLLTPNTVI